MLLTQRSQRRPTHTHRVSIMTRVAFTYRVDGLVTFSDRNSGLDPAWPSFYKTSPSSSNVCPCVRVCVLINLYTPHLIVRTVFSTAYLICSHRVFHYLLIWRRWGWNVQWTMRATKNVFIFTILVKFPLTKSTKIKVSYCIWHLYFLHNTSDPNSHKGDSLEYLGLNFSMNVSCCNNTRQHNLT